MKKTVISGILAVSVAASVCVTGSFYGSNENISFALAARTFLPLRASDRRLFPRFMDTIDFLLAFLDTRMERSVAFVL